MEAEETEIVDSEKDEKRESQKKLAEDAAAEVEQRTREKFQLRQTNLKSKGNPLQEERKLDASIKKNNAFVKKLRTMGESQRDALSRDFAGLNLTKYLQEAASAVAECRIKVTDVGCAVHISSLIVQRYNEFSPLLLQALQKQFEGSIAKGEEKSAVVSKYRLGLRLVAELVACGVLYNQKAGFELLTAMLTAVIKADQESQYNYITVLLSFCRHCAEDFMNILPRKQRELFDTFDLKPERPELVPRAHQEEYHKMLHRYFEGLKTHLLREHKALQKREKENKRILELKGELTEERIAANDQAQKAYEKLITNMGTLSDILDEDMPLLPEVEPEVRDPTSSSGVDVSFPMNTPVSESELDPHCLWEDEEIREFYQNITDIKTLVPAVSDPVATLSLVKRRLCCWGLVEGDQALVLYDLDR
jgi:regulator of nonsense transcripts 2